MALAQKMNAPVVAKAQGIVAPAVRPLAAPRRVRSSSIRAQASQALTVAQTKAVAATNGAPAPLAPVEEVDIARHMNDRHAHILR